MGHTGVRITCWTGLLWLSILLAGCPADGVNGSDGDDDGGDDAPPLADAADPADADPNQPDADPTQPDASSNVRTCDMTGTWIAEQHTVSMALGSAQNTTNYYRYEITQTGDEFTINHGFNCGFVVNGTTTVVLGDATLAVLAEQESAGPGRKGTYKPTADGTGCEFKLDRNYNLRGHVKTTYLTDVWQVGDPPKPLGEFPALLKAEPGMDDWDNDDKHGITLKSGLGDRYVGQRDWNEHAGTTAQLVNAFGGEGHIDGAHGVIIAKWDSQEAVSDQTSPILRIGSTPSGDGWARYARTTVPRTTPLATCRAIQQAAQQPTTWQD